MKVVKVVALLALCSLLLLGCGGDSKAVEEVTKENAALKERVKNLEDHLLETQKQLIQQEQTLQTIIQRQREIENYFAKMQVSTQYGR